MYRQIIKILLIASLFFIIPEVAQAGFLDDVTCTKDGSCSLEDMAAGFNSLIKLLLGGMGAVALVYFVWGGTRWLVSGGSAERVREGKTIMINTVFALILAFGSYIIINFFVNDVLKVKTDFQITEGPFVTCDDRARGIVCGNNNYSLCSGAVQDNYEHLSYKCLDACQVMGLSESGDTRIGKCLTAAEGAVQNLDPVLGIGVCKNSTHICFLSEL